MASIMVNRYGRPGAPPVVLVHGLTEAGTAWPDLVQHWVADWDIHAPDLRGHGASARFTEAELTDAPTVMLRDVLGVVDDVGQPAVVVGYSLGGLLALRAALAHPVRVRALVLEDPAKPHGSVPAAEFVARNEAFLDRVTADPDGETARMLRETSWSRAEVEAWAACKPHVDREYIRHGLALGDAAWEGLFEALDVPTLLVLPGDSDMAPRDVANPQVRTVVVPDAGHCVRRDQPTRYHRAVDAFLAEVAQTPTP